MKLLTSGFLAALTATTALACGSPLPPPRVTPSRSATPAPRSLSSGTTLEPFLPLVAGQLYHYEFHTDGGENGLLSVRIERTDERHGAWVLPGGSNAFEYATDGVLTFGEHGSSYLLQAPLQVGRRWRGAHQSWVEVRRIDATVTVPAGTFSGCVETAESRSGDVPFSVAASYCPNVGMVQRDVSNGPRHERLVLQSFGAPVDIGPDGVSVTPGN